MIVLEKKVSTSMIARKMMATVLTHSLLLDFCFFHSVNILSRCGLTLDRAGMCDALDEIRLAVEEQQQTRDHIDDGDGEGNADLAGVDGATDRRTAAACGASGSRISGCSTMFQ